MSKGQFDPSLVRFKGSKLRKSDNICKTNFFVLHLNDGQIICFIAKKKKKNLGGTSSNEWER